MKQVQISEVLKGLRLPAHFINTRAELANLIEAHGIAPPDGIDWKELYRVQTAMRYMDAKSSISTQTAFLMADTDIRSALSANAPKQEVKPNDKWGTESGWANFDESTAINAAQVKP